MANYTFLPWQDAWEWLTTDEPEQVKCVVLANTKCKACSGFYDEVLSVLDKQYDYFTVKVVDSTTVPFPPPMTPCTYFTYNFRHPALNYPEVRGGHGPIGAVEGDLKMMRRMCLEQKTATELINEDALAGAKNA
jgi:hypothetical protein